MARGKAQAMQTYLATGGGKKAARGESTRGPGTVFKKGKLRGMTQEEAEADFESKWQSVDGSIKDKYAGIAKNSLSPSEQAEYQSKQDRANDSEANFAADLGRSDLIKKGDKDAMARAYKRGGELGMSKDEIDAARGAGKTTPPTAKNPNTTNPTAQKAPVKPDTMVPGTSGIVKGPPKPVVTTAQNTTRGGNRSQEAMGTPTQQAEVAKMVNESSNQASAYMPPGMSTDNNMANGWEAISAKRDLGNQTVQQVDPKVLAANAEANKEAITPVSSLADARRDDDQRMMEKSAKPVVTTPPPLPTVPGVTNAGPAPTTTSPAPGVAPSAGGTSGRTASGAPAAPTGPKISSFTGLPMGFHPGDKLPDGAAADMQTRANDSQTRQNQAGAESVATPQQSEAADRMMQKDGVIPSRPQAIPGLVRGPASQEYRAPAPKPTAPNAGVMKSYEDSRQAYQRTLAGGGTDQEHEANKANMDKIYADASDLDKAGITGQSLRRGAAQVKQESDLLAKAKQGGKIQGVTKAAPVRPFQRF